MMVTRVTVVVGVLIYIGLWALVVAGASALMPILVVATVLVVLVAGGNLLQSYMGIPGRAQKFRQRPDDDAE